MLLVLKHFQNAKHINITKVLHCKNVQKLLHISRKCKKYVIHLQLKIAHFVNITNK